MPACGPDDRRRRSLQIFESLTAARFSVPDRVMKMPASAVASIRSGAVSCGMPVSSSSWLRTASA